MSLGAKSRGHGTETRVGCRLPNPLVRAVDTYAAEQSRATGVKYTRTDAVRRLLTLALEGLKNAKEKSK